MLGVVSGFDWDDGNREHCRKHGVSTAEIEGLFRRPIVILPDESHSQVEKRLRAICTTSPGRALFLVFTLRERDGKQLIRPISARYMHDEEIRNYEAQNPGL
jgi:uncharacterized DUF497 family protein